MGKEKSSRAAEDRNKEETHLTNLPPARGKISQRVNRT